MERRSFLKAFCKQGCFGSLIFYLLHQKSVIAGNLGESDARDQPPDPSDSGPLAYGAVCHAEYGYDTKGRLVWCRYSRGDDEKGRTVYSYSSSGVREER